MISRYPEVIRLSLRQIADSDRCRRTLRAQSCPPKKQLWDIPKRCEA